MDYEPLAAGPNYPVAAYNAFPTGEHVATFLKNLTSWTGADVGDFHAIGYSLGGQVIAGLGQAMPGLKRITALDPAGIITKRIITHWLIQF